MNYCYITLDFCLKLIIFRLCFSFKIQNSVSLFVVIMHILSLCLGEPNLNLT